MALEFYAHPFSSYCQKVLIALYENNVEFTYRILGEEEGTVEEHREHWPIGRFPTLIDDGTVVAESSIIIEHLQMFHGGDVELLPSAPKTALNVRFLDRFFDNYVMNAMQVPVAEAIRSEGNRFEEAMGEARTALEKAYAWLEPRLVSTKWAAGDEFTLADCAAAPSLFYADWVHEISPLFPALKAYRSRLLERPSFRRAVEEARPYRHYFPLGAPERD